jgi:hypothetical protein
MYLNILKHLYLKGQLTEVFYFVLSMRWGMFKCIQDISTRSNSSGLLDNISIQ